MANIEKVLALNIKDLRDGLGWNQATLAERTGLSLTAIQSYESGRRWPEKENIKILAITLRVEESRLFTDPDLITRPTPKQALEVICEGMGFHPNLKSVKQNRQLQTLPTHSHDLSLVPEEVLEALARIPGKWDLIRTFLEAMADKPAPNDSHQKKKA